MRIIAGAARGRRLEAPSETIVRPTSDRAREALFGILGQGSPLLTGRRFLDLFAGSGAVGLEAWSRGASQVTLVERDRVALAAIRQNIRHLAATDVNLLARDATRLGRLAGEPFDLIFMDPPYHSGLATAALLSLGQGGWIADGGQVIVELAARETIELPSDWQALSERRYGAARFVFLAATQEET